MRVLPHPPPILSLSRLSFLCYSSWMHACNIPQMLSKTTQNTKRLLQSLRNLVCYSDWTRSPFTSWWNPSFWLNPVVYLKKKTFEYVNVYWEKSINLLKLFLVNLQPRGERSRVAIARLVQGVQQAGNITDQISSTIRDKHVNYWSKSFYNCTCCVWCISLQID